MKIGLYCQRDSEATLGAIAQLKPAWVLLENLALPLAEAVKRVSPHTKTVGRWALTQVEQDQWLAVSPAERLSDTMTWEEALERGRRFAEWLLTRFPYPVDAWMGLNEVPIHNQPQRAARLAHFEWGGMAPVLHEHGHKLVGGNFGSGQGESADIGAYLSTAQRHGGVDYLGYHVYGSAHTKRLMGWDRRWHALRPLEIWPEAGLPLPRLLCTEGASVALDDQGHDVGPWRSGVSPEESVADVIAYAEAVGNKVEGICLYLFDAVDEEKWWGFDWKGKSPGIAEFARWNARQSKEEPPVEDGGLARLDFLRRAYPDNWRAYVAAGGNIALDFELHLAGIGVLPNTWQHAVLALREVQAAAQEADQILARLGPARADEG